MVWFAVAHHYCCWFLTESSIAAIASSYIAYSCFFFFFFSSRRRHTRSLCDWIQTCALPILVEEIEVDPAEALEGRQLDHRLDLLFEEYGQDDEVERLAFAHPGIDPNVIRRHLAHQEPLLVEGDLTDDALAQAKFRRDAGGFLVGVPFEETQDRLAVAVFQQVE